ncbi:C40 family peptidase [Fictibacillus phosphorivorans]|uniref:C40 family peptidase n=1 Tax=Fictibacillus phosphorivorans TaxID=1221500 RepID=UPI0012934FD9|nr:NlpC/P60 family protein [Fictibacillus phosphorivorans]MQR97100.1 endopeptidase [Fictibacillus phosphorivorans]
MKKAAAGLAIAGIVAFNPIVGEAALGDQTLKPGTQHSDVQDLQQTLDKKGYFSYSKTTDYYGDYTTDAVKKFQADKGITVDGIAGDETFKSLGIDATESNASIVEVAKKYEGTPYKWGGESPDGFDCSGYLQYIFDEAENVELPRTVDDIYAKGTKVDSPAVGDIVFFNLEGDGPSHAGVYIGNDQFVHASSSKGVTTAELNSSYWSENYIGAKSYE